MVRIITVLWRSGGLLVVPMLMIILYMTERMPLARAAGVTTLAIVWVVWLRWIIYHDQTLGRNYILDHHKYGRGWFELLSFYRDADPGLIHDRDLPEMHWSQAEGIILGRKGNRLVHRPSGAEGNIATFGLPGSGKTSSQIIPSILQFMGAVLTIDLKGDIYAKCKDRRRIKVFAPEDPGRSCHFDPFDGIITMTASERALYLEQLAAILVPMDGGKDARYFCGGARDYFCGISSYLLEKDPHTQFSDVVQAILFGGNFASWVRRIETGPSMEAISYLANYEGNSEANVSSCYNELVGKIRKYGMGSLKELLNGGGECISTAMLEEGYDIFLEIPQDKLDYYAPIITIIVQRFLNEFMARPDKASGEATRPIAFILDEFAQLPFDHGTLTSALSTLRSKNVFLFLAQQNLAQLFARYGEEGCREIIGTCNIITVFNAQDPRDREYFAKLFGKKRVLKISNTLERRRLLSVSQDSKPKGSSRTVHEDQEYVIEPDEFGRLSNEGKVAIYMDGRYIVAEKAVDYKRGIR